MAFSGFSLKTPPCSPDVYKRQAYKPMSVIITPSGGFLTLGILLLIVNAIVKYIGKHKQMKARGEIA